MTPSPSLAAPLSKALEPHFGPSFFPGLTDVTIHGASPEDVAAALLAVIRLDPAVLQAVADAIALALSGNDPTQLDALDEWYSSPLEMAENIAPGVLDALFGTLGAGPIASGEAAGAE